MPDQLYKVSIKAEGEVRDRDGNLVSTSGHRTDLVLDRDQVRSLLTEPDRRAFDEQDTP